MLGLIARQGRIKGLDLIDFNYPQHITSPTVDPKLKEEIGISCIASVYYNLTYKSLKV